MGNDTPISALSDKPKLLYTYFKQNFAQVTNPPIDSIREELVMSLVSFIGPRPNLFDLEGPGPPEAARGAPADPHQRGPREDPRASASSTTTRSSRRRSTSPSRSRRGVAGMATALDQLCADAEAAVHGGNNIIILSDRAVAPDRVPIPALLATAGVHHHLIRKGLRTSVGLVVETGEAREVHHFCVPRRLWRRGDQPLSRLRDAARRCKDDLAEEVDEQEIVQRYIKAIDKGILKVMAKMGISTYQSYCGAQIFDAVGLSSEFVAALLHRHRDHDRGRRPRRDRRGDAAPASRRLRRLAGARRPRSMSAATTPSASAARHHVWTPGDGRATSSTPCAATRRDKYREFARLVNETEDKLPHHPLACSASGRRRRTAARPCRSTRSSRRSTSSGASRPAPCPSARSAARRTPRSPSP